MTEIEDLETYGTPNDIAPDDPAPREPEGQPDERTDEFDVWMFEADESETVPDTYVVDRNPFPLDFRMWVFVGRGELARFVMRASHKYGEDEVVPSGREDCCEVLFDGQSLRANHCPDTVVELVEELTGASVSLPEDRTGSDSPINY